MNSITRWAAPAVLAVLLTTGACASSGEGDSSGGIPSVSGAERYADAAPNAAATEGSDASGADSDQAGGSAEEAADTDAGQAVIHNGTVSLRSSDVEQARFDAQKVIDSHKGRIADEQTRTNRDGEMRTTRLELRVPSAAFDEVMTDLGQVAELAESTRSSEDVTANMIDNNVRIRAQEKSLRRIEALLARASTVQEIVSIESELTTRQGDLDSLKRRQAYLRDQTSESTITLFIEHDSAEKPAEEDDGHNAFVAGLIASWNALKGIGGGIAVTAGAVLPFAVVIGLLGVPTLVALRRLRGRSRTSVTPETA